ncbi:conserved hypothetical protein (DUF4136) [Formosa agariphila KMM 3901]|uniref:DUF4136 domain-containing protein n=1 Tax=Formosa agariphila (strain DSM 15362 / KCTC 12365 / LMG 23005 / KMM 3901 / M-2Alg 35-1) TaxID=1347342 RepID=T2KNU2_FORAG|nr:DUF4136 domain-containing protein [Formosa agariphila]CDF80537.1 conserved hypothetical protein (DUF4136) [Formosa agariphila KMM 3901]
MKRLLKFTPVLILLLIVSACSSIKVASDYEKGTTFEQYKTYAFYKTGIDKAEISDLDKKRILRAIETEMTNKGFVKSENPDILISIFTKAREEINIYNNNNMGWGPYGYGWGWSPYYYNNFNNTSVTSSTEGTLFIDLIDASKKELVWQGVGSGYLTENMNKKEERINEFVGKILENYPPELKK